MNIIMFIISIMMMLMTVLVINAAAPATWCILLTFRSFLAWVSILTLHKLVKWLHNKSKQICSRNFLETLNCFFFVSGLAPASKGIYYMKHSYPGINYKEHEDMEKVH